MILVLNPILNKLFKFLFFSLHLNFSSNRAEGDDLLGDAYEYFMRHFATESGKSKGQFYTPSEVSRIIAKVVGIAKSTNQSQSLFEGYDAVPPNKNGDYAFLLHLIKSLKSKGKGCIVMPLGVLFRGNAEADIRKKIIQKGYIKGIIGLPPNLFYGTGIAASLIIIDKAEANKRDNM